SRTPVSGRRRPPRRSRRRTRGTPRRPGRCRPTTRGGRSRRAGARAARPPPGCGRRWRSRLHPRLVVGPQAVPEGLYAVEHPRRPGEEAVLVEPRLRPRLGQLVGGVGGVLVLDPVVPGPERERQVEALAVPEGLEPGDELLPEPRRRPVLDRVAGSLGGGGVLGAVHLEQLVAEEAGGGRAVVALAEVGEVEPERRREAQEPLEVGGPEAEPPALDGPLGGDEVRVDVVG